MRWPSGWPSKGISSSPCISLLNLTHITLCAPSGTGSNWLRVFGAPHPISVRISAWVYDNWPALMPVSPVLELPAQREQRIFAEPRPNQLQRHREAARESAGHGERGQARQIARL